MDLESVRAWLVKTTGRNDLANTDGSDNGADKYIRAGSMLLDLKMETQKSPA